MSPQRDSRGRFTSGGSDDGGGGIWVWVKTKLDKLSAQQTKKETQDALGDATDPQRSTRNLGLISRAFGALRIAALAAATAVVGGLALGLRKLINESVEAQKIQAQLRAALESTGGAAGRSLDRLNEHAAALQRITAFSDDAVGAAQAMLLTFTNVRGETFERTTEAALDMAQALGMDATSAASTLGRALQDPVRGLTLLQRQGVVFTDAQRDLIKELAETNRLAEAQGIILDQLAIKYGGSAEAARNTLGGALAALKNAWGDLFEVSQEASAGIVGAINAVTDALSNIKIAIGLRDRERVGEAFAGLGHYLAGVMWGAFARTSAVILAEISSALTPEFLERRGMTWALDIFNSLSRAMDESADTAFEAARAWGVANEALGRQLESAEQLAALQDPARAAELATAQHRATRELQYGSDATEQATTSTEDLRKAEDERFDALIDGYDAAILKVEEWLELVRMTTDAQRRLREGIPELPERLRQQRFATEGGQRILSERVEEMEVPERDMSGVLAGFGQGVKLPDWAQVRRQTEVELSGLTEFALDNWESIASGAELAAFSIQESFRNTFRILFEEGADLEALFGSVFQGMAVSALNALAEMATHKVAEQIALAIEMTARGLGDLAGGSPHTAAIWFKSAKTHYLSAAKWAVVGGGAAAAAEAIEGGGGGSREFRGRDVTGRAIDRMDRPPTIIKNYVSGFDPRNPAHIELFAAGEAERKRQWGDQEPNVRIYNYPSAEAGD